MYSGRKRTARRDSRLDKIGANLIKNGEWICFPSIDTVFNCQQSSKRSEDRIGTIIAEHTVMCCRNLSANIK